jgi:CheY-like chemotaxis protein
VILNLAVNARDAMPDGGKLVVQTSNVDLDAAGVIDKARQAPGKYVRLDVIDTGTGMSDEVKSHLFEPFFTTKEVGKGTGLGLATVHGIVKQSGGHIEVESGPGHGTTFRIFFPQVMEAVAQRPASVIMTRKGGGETVLLVEDEETVRAMIGAALRKEGYKLLVAQHGVEALDLVEKHKGPIHLAITDMVMPKMNGREFADRLQKVRSDTKVLYMSGYTDPGVAQRVLPTNMPFLQKPFTRDLLLRKLHELLDSGA